MKFLIWRILTVLLFSVSAISQTQSQTPVLLDEFERLGLDETMARLDYFSIELMKTPNATGIIRIYGGNENCFLCHYRFGSLVDAYFKNTRKFPTEKYSIEFCGKNTKNLQTQLYLLAPGSELSECEENLEPPKNSAVFDTIYFFYRGNKLFSLEDSIIEIGPTQGLYSVNVLKKVKDILEKSPESKVYILVYLGTNPETKFEEKNGKTIEKTKRNLDKKSVAGQLLSNTKNEFVKNGIKLSQIQTIEGGYVDDRRRLEFWFVPKGGEIPKPKPDYFPKK